ncbi:MAG TPA: DUF1178 family protein [Rhodobacterales bacterium]|nr:DUF1178 family protein [Rhodobacterales bacterium]
MIRYALKCPAGHRFESWFQNAAAYDALAEAGHVACPTCGATGVEKCLMTPDVRLPRAGAEAPQEPAPSTAPDAPASPAVQPESAQAQALAALKAKVEAESDYVGERFAKEARAMHAGETPERAIYGEAKPAEAIALIEDGVPVAPLPFTSRRKLN